MTRRPAMPVPECVCHGVPQGWKKDRQMTAGGFWMCVVKRREYAKQRYASGKVVAWRKASGYRWRTHGITPEQARALHARQGGKCPGCDTPKALEEVGVDHDHSCCPGKRSCGNCVRLLLCTLCNSALARLGDSPASLRRLADLLEAS
jgi:hypothetical protein